MPVFLEKHEGISFVCGREFVHNGHQYHVGDDFPNNESRNVETFVRTRHIIPVIEAWEDKPRHWHRHVLPRDIVMAKLGRRPAPLSSEALVVHSEDQGADVDEEYNDTLFEHDENYDPGEHKVGDVVIYAKQHFQDIEKIYAAEEEGKNRSTLLTQLLEISESHDNEQTEDDEDE